ncbi:MAG: TA system VapC family ribonuclease toxin [Acidimicrobiales bacterium]
MIAVDTNVVVYAHRSEFPQHKTAYGKLVALANGTSAWGIPIFVVGEFLRVVTHPRVLHPPTPMREALRMLDTLLASPSARLLIPGTRYLEILEEIVVTSRATGNTVFDAQIASVCIENGAGTILTNDRGFMMFDGITIQELPA